MRTILSPRLALLTIAFAMIPSVPMAFASHALCSDGVDNDQDARIDYPVDPDCTSLDDNTEALDNGVFVTITDNRDQVAPGEAVIYLITLKQERESVKLIDVALHVPHQSTITYTSDDGRILSDGSVQWLKVAVFKGSVRRLSIHAVLTPYAQNAQLLIARAVAENSVATDTTMVNAEGNIPYVKNQLQVTVTDGRDNVLPGESLQYVVTVRNPEPRAGTFHVRVAIPKPLSVFSPTAGAEVIGRELVWRDVTLAPNQSAGFTFRAVVDARTPNHTALQVIARAGNVAAADKTVVGSPFGPTTLFSSITDFRQSAARGELLTYTIHVDNISGRLDPDASIDAGLPVYSEFVDATEGGVWNGRSIQWLHIQVAPGGTRDLQFTIRVRSDAPEGEVLRATAYVQGFLTKDETTVIGGPMTGRPLYYRPSYSQYQSFLHYAAEDPSPLQVTTTVDPSDAHAGSTVRYTVTVRNAGRTDIENVTLESSFQQGQFTLTDLGGGIPSGGTLTWSVGRLRGGEQRVFSYEGIVASSLRPGDTVINTSRAYATEATVGSSTTTIPGSTTITSYGSTAGGYAVMMPTTGPGDGVAAVEDLSKYLTPVRAP